MVIHKTEREVRPYHRNIAPTVVNNTVVNIFVSDSKASWGAAVGSGISTWQDTKNWVEVDSTDKVGRYIKVMVIGTESDDTYIRCRIW